MSRPSPTALRPVLLTVSGVIPAGLHDDIAQGRTPRPDYTALSEAFDADLVDIPQAIGAHGRVGQVLDRIGGGALALAWYCFRRRNRYDVIVTDGEQVGIPLAALLRWTRRRARHAMIAHVLSTRTKSAAIRISRSAASIDLFIVYCSKQSDVVRSFGVPDERILLTPFMVDTNFFRRATESPTERLVCGAGLERRDYGTLIEAVRAGGIDVAIAAASPWSRQRDTLDGRHDVPANITIERLSLHDLRSLYRRARVAVMPLHETDFQAGITTILEVMSMGLPVVVSRTSGQTDTVEHGITGLYVPPGDAAALRSALMELIDDPARCTAMGGAARAWAEAHADIDVYARRLAEGVRSLRARPTEN